MSPNDIDVLVAIISWVLARSYSKLFKNIHWNASITTFKKKSDAKYPYQECSWNNYLLYKQNVREAYAYFFFQSKNAIQ